MSAALSRVWRAIRAFLSFWYGFIVGDDWTVAVAIGLALLVTAGLNSKGITAWWLLPLTVVAATAASLWRKTPGAPAPAPEKAAGQTPS